MSGTFSIRIRNMSCGACAARVQDALENVEGIEDATVNLADESAEFGVESAKVLKNAFAALEKAGYPGAPKDDGHAAARREEKENSAASLRWATLLAAALALPVLILETGSQIFPPMRDAVQNSIGTETSWQLQSVLTTIVLIGPGLRFFRRGLSALFRRAPDVNSLVSLGTGAAYFYSVFILAAPELLPEQARVVYFDMACWIIILMLVGRLIEVRSGNYVHAAIERLIQSRPSPPMRVEVDGDRLSAGAHAAIERGNISGTGQIFEPPKKVNEARFRSLTLLDQITLRYVSCVLICAALAMGVWGIVGPTPRLPFMFLVGMMVLIAACPCAIAFATSVSIMIGTRRAAELGIFFRGGAALEYLQSEPSAADGKFAYFKLFAISKPSPRNETAPKVSRAVRATETSSGERSSATHAYADFNVALGTDADDAIKAADIVFISGDHARVAATKDIAQKTMRNIRQNLVLAFGLNIALIPVAAGALYPHFGIVLSPCLIAVATGLSTLLVLGNALRLRAVLS